MPEPLNIDEIDQLLEYLEDRADEHEGEILTLPQFKEAFIGITWLNGRAIPTYSREIILRLIMSYCDNQELTDALDDYHYNTECLSHGEMPKVLFLDQEVI